jgi:site-specific recombinase XerC
MDRYLTESEQARLLRVFRERCGASAIDRRDAAFFGMLLHSGMRIGEASRISVGQAMEALRTGYLYIPAPMRKGKRHDHHVYVTEVLRADLQGLLAARCEISPEACGVDDALVVGRGGQAMTVRALELRFDKWVALADLPAGASPHWLRHTRAQNIIRRSSARNPLGVVQSALGHASIRSTGIYTGPSREDVEAALAETDGRAGRVTRAQLRRAYEGRAA